MGDKSQVEQCDDRWKDEHKVGVRQLYVEATENLRFAKGRQWTLSYYILFLYAGIYGAHLLLRKRLLGADSSVLATVDCLTIIVAILAATAGFVIIFSYQRWMQKERKRLNRIYDWHADERFKHANREQMDLQRISECITKDPQVWLPLVLIELAAAAWLVASVYWTYGKALPS